MRRLCKALGVGIALGISGCGGCALPALWTTYRGDAQRSGLDPSSFGSAPIALAWTSPRLAGNLYGQPLVYRGRVLVATESDDVYALDQSTGKVVWHAAAGVPVPAGALPCGDISPTVGITSTPVIDPATNRLFVVADTWNGSSPSSIAHRLYAFNLANGSGVSGFPVTVDPPGSVPADQLQRPALALDAGKVVIGFGGNDGDCGTYNGWLVAVPTRGGSLATFKVEPGATGGAIWGAGTGPAVDASQHLWVATGNGFGSTFAYQESVLKLDSSLRLLDHWAPSDWAQLDSHDTDLGSGEPLLLPGGLVFEIGKGGLGYLLSAANLGGTGASPLYHAQVCGRTSDASFGGAIYYANVIYVSCADGLRALALNRATSRFSALPGWNVTGSAIGPPIISGGRVWATDWSGATLYGLDLTTGKALVRQSTPSMMHFSAPAAANGKLFLATGQTVEAYTASSPIFLKAASASVSFSPDSIGVGQSTVLSFELRRRASQLKVPGRLTDMSVTAVLPKGLEVRSRVRVSGPCRRTIAAEAVPGTRTITVRAYRLNWIANCTMTVTITGTSPGRKTTKLVVSSNGQPIAQASSARLKVVGPRH